MPAFSSLRGTGSTSLAAMLPAGWPDLQQDLLQDALHNTPPDIQLSSQCGSLLSPLVTQQPVAAPGVAATPAANVFKPFGEHTQRVSHL